MKQYSNISVKPIELKSGFVSVMQMDDKYIVYCDHPNASKFGINSEVICSSESEAKNKARDFRAKLRMNNEISEMDKGIEVEMEHRELIVKMLKEAGKEPTEEMIKRIASEIAKVHIEEDPKYYEKLEKIEKNSVENGYGPKEMNYKIVLENGLYYIYARSKNWKGPYGNEKFHIVTPRTFKSIPEAESYIRDNLR